MGFMSSAKSQRLISAYLHGRTDAERYPEHLFTFIKRESRQAETYFITSVFETPVLLVKKI